MKYLRKINFLVVLAILASFVFGWNLGNRDFRLEQVGNGLQVKVSNKDVPASHQDIDFKLFWDTWDLVSREYVDKKALDPQKMYYGAIKGMVEAIGDPYTTFLPPEAQKITKEDLGGTFEGVGIQLDYDKDKRLVVVAPLSGTPADKAGVKAGDFIVKIDGKETNDITIPEAVKLIKGPKGTSVKIETYHEGDPKTKEISLVRDTILVKSVEYSLKNTTSGKKVGYIKLSRFGDKTAQEWNEAVSSALADAPSSIIVDVRNNPGGYLDMAVYIGSEFIEKGDVVMQEDANGKRDGYPITRPGRLLKYPVVVLMNKGSASASEIVAGALQDYGRAKLVGTQSFGKGTIQSSRELPGGTGIHITTAKWLTPKGRWIHGVGLTPDTAIEFGDDKAKDLQLDKALELLN